MRPTPRLDALHRAHTLPPLLPPALLGLELAHARSRPQAALVRLAGLFRVDNYERDRDDHDAECLEREGELAEGYGGALQEGDAGEAEGGGVRGAAQAAGDVGVPEAGGWGIKAGGGRGEQGEQMRVVSQKRWTEKYAVARSASASIPAVVLSHSRLFLVFAEELREGASARCHSALATRGTLRPTFMAVVCPCKKRE